MVLEISPLARIEMTPSIGDEIFVDLHCLLSSEFSYLPSFFHIAFAPIVFLAKHRGYLPYSGLFNSCLS